MMIGFLLKLMMLLIHIVFDNFHILNDDLGVENLPDTPFSTPSERWC